MTLPPKLWHFLHSRGFRRFLIASPFLAIAAIAAFYGGVNLWGAANLDRARQQLRDQGDPLTVNELISRNPPPEQDLQVSKKFQENRRLRIRDTIIELTGSDSALRFLQGDPPRGVVFSASRLLHGAIPDEPAAARKVLAALAPLAPKLDQSVAALKQSKGIGHPTDPSVDIPDIPMTAFSYAIQDRIFDLFSSRACLHAAAGEGDRALDDLRFLTDWCRLHDQAPRRLMEICIRMNTAAIIANAAWDIAAQPSMTEPQLAALQRDLADVEILSPAVDAWRIERLLIMVQVESYHGRITAVDWHRFNHIFDWSAPADWWPNASEFCRQLRPVGFAKADLAAAMDIINRDFLHRPDGSPRQFWNKAAADRIQAIQDAKPVIKNRGRDPFNDFTHDLHGIAAYNINRTLETNATVRLAILTVAAQRHQRAHGRFPATIAELVPAFIDSPPNDPMSDQTIRLEPQADGSIHLTAPGTTIRSPITWILPR